MGKKRLGLEVSEPMPSSPDDVAQERFQPLKNLPPGATLTGRLRSLARRVLDLQVHSVLTCLTPWIKARQGRVLEVGCGAQPYRHLLPANCDYQGLDWAMAGEVFDYHATDVQLFSGGPFPFPDASFDSVFHTEVLKHVPDPLEFLQQCRRVLKPGGALFFSVPFQARFHYIPHDYWRFTPSGLALLLGKAGFAEVTATPRGTDVTVAAYKTLSLTYRWLQEGPAGKALGICSLPLALACLVAGHTSLALKRGSTDDCLGYAVTASAV